MSTKLLLTEVMKLISRVSVQYALDLYIASSWIVYSEPIISLIDVFVNVTVSDKSNL